MFYYLRTPEQKTLKCAMIQMITELAVGKQTEVHRVHAVMCGLYFNTPSHCPPACI